MHFPTLFSVVSRATRLVLFFACMFLCLEVRGESKSEKRSAQLRQLAIKALEAQGADAPEEAIQAAVLAKFANVCEAPVPPEKKAVSSQMSNRKLESMLQQGAEKAFPMPEDETLAEEAAKEYPIHQIGAPVSITFSPNPIRTVEVSGVYQGRTEKFIKIGSRSILISDIRAVPGNEEELKKFFPDQAREKRRQYIARRRADIFARRDQWKKEHRDEMLRLVLRKQTEVNQARGYILHANQWSTPEAVLAGMLPALRKQVRVREQRRMASAEAENRAADRASPDLKPTPAEGAPSQPSPEDAAEAGQADENGTTPDADTETAASATDSDLRGNEQDAVGAQATDIAVLPILAVLIGGLIVIAVILCWPEKERGRYYPGQGQGEEEISHPFSRFADIPHVIGRFPNRERARNIMGGVSFLSLSSKSGRELSCRLPLEYGFVPEDEGATILGFIAGTAFEYTLWREARDLMHRSRNAELLSAQQPSSDVHIPREGAVADAVAELGQFEGDDHDPSCYWLFHADTREAAKAFLKQVRVNTPGWHVIVQTPQGHWGRDSRGLYQE